MYQKGIHGVEFIVCNTDAQVLGLSPVPRRLLIGQKLTGGLGCGADPERGKQAAQESVEEIRQVLQPPLRMVFLTAGLGGGTGTGAIPVVAELCQSLGLLTVAVVTLPFYFEGKPRKKNAIKGLIELEKHVDALVIIQNDNITRLSSPNMRQKEAFLLADQVLYRAVRGIAEVVTKPGYINVDFADVKTVMQKGGYTLLGMSQQRGENRAIMAIEEALSSPLLDDVDIRGARAILVNITASEETLEMQEVDQIMKRLAEAVGDADTDVIMGQVFDDAAGDELSITLIATGLGQPESIRNLITTVHTAPSASLHKKKENTTPPLLEMELPLSAVPSPPVVEEPPATFSLQERLRQIENDPRALEKAQHSPAYQRLKRDFTQLTSPPSSLSSTRLEPSDETGMGLPLRRHNPRLYDNAD
jgi:cell division protein FtsZ